MRKLKIGLPRWNSGQVGLMIATVMLVGMMGVGWGAPNLINIQGRLLLTRDLTTGAVLSQPVPVTGNQSIRINFYTQDTGGTPISGISGRTYTVNCDSNGIFNQQIGSDTAIWIPDFSTDNYWVEIQVANIFGYETFTTRQRLVSVPYAISSKNAITAMNVRGTATAFDGYPIDARIDNIGNSQSAIYGQTNGSGYGLYAKGIGNTSGGVKGEVTISTNSNYAVYGYTAGTGAAVYGSSVGGYGVSGKGPTTKGGVTGTTNASLTSAFTNFGVLGDATAGYGVVGNSYSSYGVYGKSVSGSGVYGMSTSGNGIYGTSTSGYGLWAEGARGVIGFDRAHATDQTGTYGLLGGLPLHWDSAEGGVRKYGVFGQANEKNRAVLGYYRLAPDATIPTTYAVYGWNIDTNGTGVYGFSQSGIGVSGSSASSTLAGIKAENTGGGPALEIGTGTIKINSTPYTFTSWPGAGTSGMELFGGLGRVEVPLTHTKDIDTELLDAKAGTIFYPATLSSTPTSFYSNALIFVKSNVITSNSQIIINTNKDDCRVVKIEPDANNRFILFLTGRNPAGHTGVTKGRIDFIIIN